MNALLIKSNARILWDWVWEKENVKSIDWAYLCFRGSHFIGNQVCCCCFSHANKINDCCWIQSINRNHYIQWIISYVTGHSIAHFNLLVCDMRRKMPQIMIFNVHSSFSHSLNWLFDFVPLPTDSVTFSRCCICVCGLRSSLICLCAQ